MQVAVVYNPTAGGGEAQRVLDASVRPALEKNQAQATYHATEAEHGARRVGRHVFESGSGALTVVVLGGDGTAHELLDGMAGERGFPLTRPVSLVLVPTGTANALYASLFSPDMEKDGWQLHSLQAWIDKKAPSALTVMQVAVPGEPKHFACVVASQALHAAILRDSEALRASHPGIERFKIAAQQNMTAWSDAELVLYPGKRGVQQYNPRTKSFEELAEAEMDGVVVDGPFVYMNAMTVDRLEPQFVPAPFASAHYSAELQRGSDQLDVIVVRPRRSPALQHDDISEGEREQFASGPLAQVMFQGMYKNGAHVDFVYAKDGSVQPSGDGAPVVEYFRAAGYEWRPDASDAKAGTTCIDGTVINASLTHVTADGQCGVSVYQ